MIGWKREVKTIVQSDAFEDGENRPRGNFI